MEKTQQRNFISFLQLFNQTSIHPDLSSFQSQSVSNNFGINIISKIWIDFLPTTQLLSQGVHYYKLNKKIALYIQISQSPIAITNIGLFSKPPQGWQPIHYPNTLNNQTKMKICVKKNQLVFGMLHVESISICQNKHNQIKSQTTQPTISQNDQCQTDQLYLEQYGIILNLKKTNLCIQNFQKAYFKPHTSALYMNYQIKNIDLQTLSYLCYPKGIRVYKKPSGFKIYNFTITLQTGQRLYCYCVAFRQKCNQIIQQRLCKMFNFMQGNQLYVQKTFCLISQYSSTDQLHLCMEAIYKMYLSSSQQQFKKVMEDLPYICCKDQNSSLCKFQSKILSINWKMNTRYPTTSINAIYCVFKFLSVENIIQLVQGILLQSKIFFISDCKSILGYAIQAFLSFIFPLKWVHAIISILPQNTISYVQAPMASIFGISNSQAERIQKQFQSSPEALYVYLDKNIIVDKRQQKYPKLPKILRQGLKKRLQNFQVYDQIDIRDYLGNPQNISLFKTRKIQDPSFSPYRIRNIFLQLMIALMKDYKEYFIQEPKKQQTNQEQRKSLKRIYDVSKLKKAHRNSQFLKDFFECGIFTQFIQCRYSQPYNKWINFFDKACQKIIIVQKNQMIKQQSEFEQSSQQQQEYQRIGRGCLSMINMFSKDSQQQKSPNKRKNSYKQKEERMVITKMKKVKQQDNPQDNIYKNTLTIQQFNDKRISQNTIQVEERQPNERQNGHHFCLFFTYKKIKSSRVAKKINKSMKKLKKWFNQNKLQNSQNLQ